MVVHIDDTTCAEWEKPDIWKTFSKNIHQANRAVTANLCTFIRFEIYIYIYMRWSRETCTIYDIMKWYTYTMYGRRQRQSLKMESMERGEKRKKEETRRVWTIERWTGGSWSHRRAEGGTHRGPRRDRRREYYRSFVGQFPERFPHLGWKKWFSLTCAPRSTARRASLCSRRRLCWAISRCCLAAMLSSSLSTSTAPPPPTGNWNRIKSTSGKAVTNICTGWKLFAHPRPLLQSTNFFANG